MLMHLAMGKSYQEGAKGKLMTDVNLEYKLKATYIRIFVKPTMAEALRAVADWLEPEEAGRMVLAITVAYVALGTGEEA